MAQEPRHRSEEERLAAVQHLQYEIDMLVFTADTLSAGSERLSQPEINVLLESFTVHSRALLGVFFPRHSHPEDVLAQHFMPDGLDWAQVVGDVPDSLTKVHERVGTEIVHLSYGRNRISEEAKKWNITQIKTDLLTVVETFRAHAIFTPKTLPTVEIIPADWPERTNAKSTEPIFINSIAVTRLINQSQPGTETKRQDDD